jgi:pimeloyl-ACP methyl ester carboxylesterase
MNLKLNSGTKYLPQKKSIMPEFGSPFSGLAIDRKLTEAELIRSVRFMVAAEYKAVQMCRQLTEFTYNNLAVEFLKGIADEEGVHAGEFLLLLEPLAPDEKAFYAKGAAEVKEEIKKMKKSDFGVDKICSYDLAEQMNAGNSNSRLVAFGNSGHCLFLEDTQKFNDELIQFSKR